MRGLKSSLAAGVFFLIVVGLGGEPAIAQDQHVLFSPRERSCQVRVDLFSQVPVSVSPDGNMTADYVSVQFLPNPAACDFADDFRQADGTALASRVSELEKVATQFSADRMACNASREDLAAELAAARLEIGRQNAVIEECASQAPVNLIAQAPTSPSDQTPEELLRSLETLIRARAVVGAATPEDERVAGSTSKVSGILELAQSLDSQIRQASARIEEIANRQAAAGDSDGAERLRRGLGSVMKDGADVKQQMRIAMRERDEALVEAQAGRHRLLTAVLVAAMFAMSVLVGSLMRIRAIRKTSGGVSRRAVGWKGDYVIDLAAQLQLTSWVPFAALGSLVVGGVVTAGAGLLTDQAVSLEGIFSALTGLGALFASAMAAIGWRTSIANQLREFEREIQ